MAAPGATHPPLNSADEAYHRLRQLLTTGTFEPGQRLREIQLSAQLGVSRTPVREALRRLQSDGLVITAGRGAMVATLSSAQVGSMYEFRAALESLSARLAATHNAEGHVSRSQLERLTSLREAVEGAGSEGDARVVSSANLDLHRYIAELSDNEFVIDALSRVWDRIAIATLSNVSDPAWSATIHRHHRLLTDAIAGGDAARAADIALEHVRQASAVYRQSPP